MHFQTLPTFIAKGNTNLLAAFMPLLRGLLNDAPAVLPVVLFTISGLGLTMAWCTLHLHFDNIMMVPALLACWRNLLRAPCRGNVFLAVLMALSIWTPPSLLQWIPGHEQAQSLIWLVVGAELFRQELNQPATRQLP